MNKYIYKWGNLSVYSIVSILIAFLYASALFKQLAIPGILAIPVIFAALLFGYFGLRFGENFFKRLYSFKRIANYVSYIGLILCFFYIVYTRWNLLHEKELSMLLLSGGWKNGPIGQFLMQRLDFYLGDASLAFGSLAIVCQVISILFLSASAVLFCSPLAGLFVMFLFLPLGTCNYLLDETVLLLCSSVLLFIIGGVKKDLEGRLPYFSFCLASIVCGIFSTFHPYGFVFFIVMLLLAMNYGKPYFSLIHVLGGLLGHIFTVSVMLLLSGSTLKEFYVGVGSQYLTRQLAQTATFQGSFYTENPLTALTAGLIVFASVSFVVPVVLACMDDKEKRVNDSFLLAIPSVMLLIVTFFEAGVYVYTPYLLLFFFAGSFFMDACRILWDASEKIEPSDEAIENEEKLNFHFGQGVPGKEVTVTIEGHERTVKLLDNPIALPPKKESKELDYDYPVSDDDDYDYHFEDHEL